MSKLSLLKLKYGFDSIQSKKISLELLKKITKKDVSLDEISAKEVELYDVVSAHIKMNQEGCVNLFMTKKEFSILEELINLCDYVYLNKNTVIILTDQGNTPKFYNIIERKFY